MSGSLWDNYVANGVWLLDHGHYAEAEEAFEEALQAADFERDDKRYIANLHYLADVCERRGKYERAEAVYGTALALAEASPALAGSPDLAETYMGLALLCVGRGRYARAEPLLERALAIYEATTGTDTADVAMLTLNLAVARFEQGKLDQAEPLYGRALAIWERLYGPAHPAVVKTLQHQARFLRATGRAAEADAIAARIRALERGRT
jgi:tetratricopeptide (TPR) repeat protein